VVLLGVEMAKSKRQSKRMFLIRPSGEFRGRPPVHKRRRAKCDVEPSKAPAVLFCALAVCAVVLTMIGWVTEAALRRT
jgi:hypothetical protein